MPIWISRPLFPLFCLFSLLSICYHHQCLHSRSSNHQLLTLTLFNKAIAFDTIKRCTLKLFLSSSAISSQLPLQMFTCNLSLNPGALPHYTLIASCDFRHYLHVNRSWLSIDLATPQLPRGGVSPALFTHSTCGLSYFHSLSPKSGVILDFSLFLLSPSANHLNCMFQIK